MRMISVYFAGIAIVAVLFGQACSAQSGARKPAENPAATNISWVAGNTLSYKCQDWELRVKYLNMGSRSEGQDGELLKDGKPMKYPKTGMTLETPLGRMKYYGSERKVAWGVTGWNFAERSRIKNSAMIKVRGGKDNHTRQKR